jgi:outer membrane protein assembly factor BamB
MRAWRRNAFVVLPLAAALSCDGPSSPLAVEPAEVLWSAAVGPRAVGPIVVADPVPNGSLLVLYDPPLLTARNPGGQVVWSREPGPGDPGAFPSLTARGGIAYVLDGGITAVRIADGSLVWSAPAPGGGFLAADADRLYRIRQSAITALDPATGAPLWEAEVTESFGAVAVRGGVVSLAAARVACRDGATGQTVWIAAPPPPAVVVDLAIGAGSVMAATAAGELLAYDARTGGLVWSRALPAPARGAASSGLTVFACASDGEKGACLALDESNGALRWSVGTVGDASPPFVAGGFVVVNEQRGILVLDAATGGVVRALAPPAEDFDQAVLVAGGDALYARLFGQLLAIRLL